MLVLLVIFMVTAPLMDNRMALTLPANSPITTKPAPRLALEVAPGDLFRLAGMPVAPAQLQGLLERRLLEQPGFVLELVVHPDADYQSATTAMAAAERAGVTNIRLD